MAAACVLTMTQARADDAGVCAGNQGSFISGVVVSGPRFAPGHSLKGVELSHTHVRVKSDQDGQFYDVAMDNVFAAGYDSAGEQAPAPLDAIGVGAHLELCGQLYPQGNGIHWVHTDCGDTPTPRSPEGWVKLIDSNGFVGDNLEASTEYCGIFHPN
jgi:hypothetical protein